MGKGAYMLIVNNDSSNHSIDIHNRNCMYDDGDSNSNISLWDNQTLSPLEAMPATGMQYIEAKASGSCTLTTSSFDVTIDGKTTITISESNNTYSCNVDNTQISVQADINNMGNGSQAYITIVINRQSYTTWMKDFDTAAGGKFYAKKLCQICVPGAHDAGMSVLTKSTSLSSECNTQTQEHTIGEQLQYGTRYFDLRPAIWTDSDDDIYMGHFSNWWVLGEEGSIGQSLSAVLDEVATFMKNDAAANGKEIVILKFSHFVSQDNTGFTKKNLGELVSALKDTLGDYMYTNTAASVNLGDLLLSDIASTGKRVICVFSYADTPDDGNTFSQSDFDAIIDPTTGIFSFGDNDSSANYRLYDQYANNHDYDDMLSDQLKKWKNFSSKDSSMFLFSYTLTSTSGGLTTGFPVNVGAAEILFNALSATNAEGDTIRDCVLKMAESANPVLLANLAYNKNKSNITAIPNILYIDKVSSHHAVNEAMYINKLFL